jgi:hypothetical protein
VLFSGQLFTMGSRPSNGENDRFPERVKKPASRGVKRLRESPDKRSQDQPGCRLKRQVSLTLPCDAPDGGLMSNGRDRGLMNIFSLGGGPGKRGNPVMPESWTQRPETRRREEREIRDFYHYLSILPSSYQSGLYHFGMIGKRTYADRSGLKWSVTLSPKIFVGRSRGSLCSGTAHSQ